MRKTKLVELLKPQTAAAFACLAVFIFSFALNANAYSWTETSQSDWETGSSSPLTADISSSPGSIKLKRTETAFDGSSFADGVFSEEDSFRTTYLDNGVIKLGRNYIYTINTNPAISDWASAVTSSFYATSTNLLYIGTTNGGITVINTQGTFFPEDDVVETAYKSATDPSIGPSDQINYIYLDSSANILYVCTGSGLALLDLNSGETAASTDGSIPTYSSNANDTENGNPFLKPGNVNHVFVDNEQNRLYISTDAGLSVINTNGTPTTTIDDIVVIDDQNPEEAIAYNANTDPAIPNDKVYQAFKSDDILYISTDGGLTFINDPVGDNSILKIYDNQSDPAIAGSAVYNAFFDNQNQKLYVSTNNGLSVIDLADGSVIANYTGSTDVTLEDSYVNSSFIDPASGLIYASTGDPDDPDAGGVTVINPSDNSVVDIYNKHSKPLLFNQNADSAVKGGFIEGNVLYLNTYGGLSVFNLGEDYNLRGDFYSLPIAASNTPRHDFSYIGTSASGQATDIKFRYGSENSFWIDNFDDADISNINIAGDVDGNNHFSSIEAISGYLVLKTNNYGDPEGDANPAWTYINTGTSTKESSKVIMKVRHIGPGRAVRANIIDFYQTFYGPTTVLNDQWSYLTLTFPDTFEDYTPTSSVGLAISLGENWSDEDDRIEVDWISVEPAAEDAEWTEWFSNNELESKFTATSSWLQYKASLSKATSSDSNSSPSINSITFASAYATSSEYLSSVFDAGSAKHWLSLSLDGENAAGSSIMIFTRSGGSSNTDDSSWSEWATTTPLISSPDSRYLQYKIALATADDKVTPAVSSITVNYEDIAPAQNSSGAVILPPAPPAATAAKDDGRAATNQEIKVEKEIIKEETVKKEEIKKETVSSLKKGEVKGVKIIGDAILKNAGSILKDIKKEASSLMNMAASKAKISLPAPVFYGRFVKPLESGGAKLSKKTADTIALFIKNGSPALKSMSWQERFDLVNNYKKYFGNAPKEAGDWENVLKIGNNIQPELNKNAEKKAAAEFKKIFGKNAEKKNKSEMGILKTIATGASGAAKKVIPDKEAEVIFKWIYGKEAKGYSDKNIVKAISYGKAGK